jgi:hypothetical protein
MNTQLLINNHYSLTDANNYRGELNNTIGDIVHKYNLLLIEYLSFIVENISGKNMEYNKFIIERGIETITHVFTILLHYSRNVDMAYYHGQKSFYFYVEFIGQISDDQHTFLNLSSRDASMFVYKKTIFEITNEVRKNQREISKETLEKLEILNVNICIFKNIIYFTLQEMNFLEKSVFIANLIKHIESACNKLLKYKFTIQEYNIIENFIRSMNKKISTSKYYEIIDMFMQKYSKIKPESLNKITELKITEKFIDVTCDAKLNESSEKFIKWIFA